MKTTRWAAALIPLLVASGTVHANVAVPLYKSDPNYERAHVARRIAFPVICVSVPMVLLLCLGRHRSSGVKLGGCAFALAGLFALATLGLSDQVVFEEDLPPAPPGLLRPPRVGGSPLTYAEEAIWVLVVSGVVIIGGLGLVRQFRKGDAAAATPKQKAE